MCWGRVEKALSATLLKSTVSFLTGAAFMTVRQIIMSEFKPADQAVSAAKTVAIFTATLYQNAVLSGDRHTAKITLAENKRLHKVIMNLGKLEGSF